MKPGISKKLAQFLLPLLLAPQFVYSAQLEPYTEMRSTDFSLPDLNGHMQKLQDYRGKVVLVNFWASWCLPCIQEMPAMQRLANSLHDQDFVLLTLNISDPARRIAEVLKRLQLEMTVLLDYDSKTFQAWQGQVLPTSYLLDRTGQVAYRVVGPTDWEDADVVSKIEHLIQSR